MTALIIITLLFFLMLMASLYALHYWLKRQPHNLPVGLPPGQPVQPRVRRSYQRGDHPFGPLLVLLFLAGLGFVALTLGLTNNTASALTGTIPQAKLAVPPAAPAGAQPANSIVGVVWQDNGDGQYGFEAGVPGITVTAYDAANNAVASTTTNVTGAYTLTGIISNTTVRVEFTQGGSAITNPTFTGPDMQGAVRFAQAGDRVNMGLLGTYRFGCSAGRAYTSCFVSGDYSGPNANGATLVSAPYGVYDTGNGTYNSKHAAHQDTGTVFGVSVSPDGQKLYSAAAIIRGRGAGPGGDGAVYVTDLTANTTQILVNLTTLGYATGGYTNRSGVDLDGFLGAGRGALGGIDVSEDGNTLYTVNLAEKSLMTIDLTASPIGAGDVTSTPIPNPGCRNSNTGTVVDDHRPFALKIAPNGLLYVGVTCSGETSKDNNDLALYVYEYDYSGTPLGFTEVFSTPLDFSKGRGWTNQPPACATWHAWTDLTSDYTNLGDSTSENVKQLCYPQPLLTDLEFADDGSMFLGVAERAGLAFGKGLDPTGFWPDPNTLNPPRPAYLHYANGSIYLAYRDVAAGRWIMENGGDAVDSSGNIIYTGSHNVTGPGGSQFVEDSFSGHEDVANGGLGYAPGSSELIFTMTDPANFFSFGFRYADSTNGRMRGNYHVMTGNNATAWKSAFLGDVDVYCPPRTPPLQIGNRVWFDADSDGIQDADELPLAGVEVVLYQGGNPVATATTNADGTYYFIGNDNPITQTLTGADTHFGIAPTITPNTAYEIRIDLAQGSLTNLIPTAPNTNSGANSDIRDSDGVSSGGVVIAPVTTGNAGDNNYTYDFGFFTQIDYGDLPDTYGTTLANNGAYHIINGPTNPTLGSTVDAEPDGQPSPNADGDDTNSDDEDGVTIPTLVPGETVTITVTYNNPTNGDTYLNAWLDLDGDGVLDQIATDQVVPSGSGSIDIAVTVPATATLGNTYARFRLSSQPGLPPTGPAPDGEVEDYVVTIQPAKPGLVVDKAISLAEVAPNQIVTYTLRVTNTGTVPLNPVVVTDTMESGLTYITGSANPAPNQINGQVLVWTDLTNGTPLAPQASVEITFLAQVTTTIGTYRNFVVSQGNHPSGSSSGTDEVVVIVEDPTVDVTKEVVSPGVVNGLITFTIRITNTGPSTLDTVPLLDSFSGPVEYERSSIPADSVDNVNQVLGWNDLTRPAPNGFGRNLAPNEVFVIEVVFRLTTTDEQFSMSNRALVSNGQDTLGNRANDGDDTVELINEPTAVDLLYFTGHQEGTAVRLDWATAVEYDNFGFRLLRSSTAELANAAVIVFIPGQGQGTAAGATYTYLDKTVAEGQTYTYWLVDVDYNGTETPHPLTTAVSLSSGGKPGLYLPLILK